MTAVSTAVRSTCAALAAFTLLTAAPLSARAEDLTPKQTGEIVDAMVKAMDFYVHTDSAKATQALLRKKRPEYLKIKDRKELADALSKDLKVETHDLHLNVSVRTQDATAPRPDAAQQEKYVQRLAYGMMGVRRLPGNIGYLKLRYFMGGPDADRMIDDAMRMLKDTDALIIDLRQNTGGGGNDARLLGHLSKTPIRMEAIRWRREGGRIETVQREPSVPEGGPLYGEKPVYVLIAQKTFSAAEAFAYSFKVSKRGLVIGEKSRGGGNPSDRPAYLGYGLSAFVPNGEAVHPVTNAGWEGVGVEPDVATAPDEALTEAYRRALNAAQPGEIDPRTVKDRADALADPKAALMADQIL